MKVLQLPPGMRVDTTRSGIRFQGTAPALRALSASLRPLASSPDHTIWRVPVRGDSPWKLVSQEQYPVLHRRFTVIMPPDAWAVIVWKLLHVSSGLEGPSFQFAECGYLRPAPNVDVAIDLLGDPEPL
ncbi:MAG: hypothetical protein RL885_09255 [Planctomycetota bacterium]